MFSLKRIGHALRAYIAELPLGHYFFGAVAAAVICVIVTLVSNVEDQTDASVILTDYQIFTSGNVMGIITTAGVLAAAILGLVWTTRELKEENRRGRLLSLPLSQAERTASVLIMNWFYLPLISIIPAFAVVGLYVSFGDTQTLFPSLASIWPAVPAAWLSVLILSVFYLFPAVHVPRRIILAVTGMMLLAGFYLALTREDFSSTVEVVHHATVLDEPDVVGMFGYGTERGEAGLKTFRYSLPNSFGWPEVLAVLSLIVLCVASVVGLHRKTA